MVYSKQWWIANRFPRLTCCDPVTKFLVWQHRPMCPRILPELVHITGRVLSGAWLAGRSPTSTVNWNTELPPRHPMDEEVIWQRGWNMQIKLQLWPNPGRLYVCTHQSWLAQLFLAGQSHGYWLPLTIVRRRHLQFFHNINELFIILWTTGCLPQLCTVLSHSTWFEFWQVLVES